MICVAFTEIQSSSDNHRSSGERDARAKNRLRLIRLPILVQTEGFGKKQKKIKPGFSSYME